MRTSREEPVPRSNPGLIPIVFEDTRLADLICNVDLRAPVSSLHELLSRQGQDSLLTLPLSPTQESFLLGMQENIGRLPPVRIVGRAQIARILDSVYNTALEWALRLESEGILGEGLTFTEAEKEIATGSTEIRIENFQGILGNVSDSSVSQNLTMTVQRGDLKALTSYLESIGVTSDESNELVKAIKADPVPISKEALGPRTKAWLGKVMLRIATAGAAIGTGASGDLVAQAIWKYFGL